MADDDPGDNAGAEEPVPLEARGVEPDSTPAIRFRHGDSAPGAELSEDIEVVEDLDIPATAEERQARLAEIKIEIHAEHSRFKVHREAYFRGVIKLGALLIEVAGALMPTPLSRMLISTASPRSRVETLKVGLNFGSPPCFWRLVAA